MKVEIIPWDNKNILTKYLVPVSGTKESSILTLEEIKNNKKVIEDLNQANLFGKDDFHYTLWFTALVNFDWKKYKLYTIESVLVFNTVTNKTWTIPISCFKSELKTIIL